MKIKLAIILLSIIFFQTELWAGGISVDAGLTPPQDRIILRTQYRYMSMYNSMMSMNTQMTPLILAYGVTSGFTLMVRSMYVHRTIENTTKVSSGINDLYILSKFRLYRKNTANYVFGIAPHIASNIPIGSKEISDRSWNPELGINISFRPRYYAIDVSIFYVFSDLSGKLDSRPGNVFSINTAFSALIPLKNNSSTAISPVLEMTYTYQGKSESEPMNDILFLSPGVSFIHSNLTLEALVQLPVFQTEDVSIMYQNSRLIIGLKYMF